jgi:hypothetical protein
MKPKIRAILEDCISNGIDYGLSRAHKHTDNPNDAAISLAVSDAIWFEIDDKFDFDRDLVSEVMEGFDHLRENI